jgi:hypothetical protein
MAKTLQLTIPSQCHENWHAMKAAEQGRYCMACCKTVIDFTNMSDREILQHITKNPGNLCGRLHTDQLNRSMVLQKERNLPWLRYFFQFTLPALFISLKAQAQDAKKPATVQVQETQKNIKIAAPALLSNGELAIRGRVLDQENYPIAGASVIIKGSTRSMATDAEGYFKFTCKDEKILTLQISYVGFKTYEIAFTPSRVVKTDSIILTHLPVKLDEIIRIGAIAFREVKPKRSALEIVQ